MHLGDVKSAQKCLSLMKVGRLPNYLFRIVPRFTYDLTAIRATASGRIL